MNRSTMILFLLLLALGAIAYFLIPSSEERESSDKSPDISFAVDSASVVKIALMRGGKTMTLENVGGKWMITEPASYNADAAAVFQLLSGLTKFKVGSLISSNPEKQKLFQVDSSGTQITATERSGKSNGMIIGKMGPSFSEVYCRPPGSKNVFLGEGIDSWTVTKEIKEWRDKAIASIPSESVKGLTYSLNNREYDYVRDSSSWRLGEAPVESGVMNPPLSTLAGLRADDFVDTVMRFTTPPIGLSVKGSAGLSLQLHPSLPDSSKYFVQSSGSQQLYVISKYTAQQLLKPVDHSRPAQRSPFAKKEEPKKPPVQANVVQKQAPPPAVVEKTPPPTQTKKETGSPVISEKPSSKAPVVGVTATKKPPPSKSTSAPVIEEKTSTPPKKEESKNAPPPAPITDKSKPAAATGAADDEGELTVYTVKSGDTMPIIAKKYNCSVEQILKWNLLKSISVKPGQELYIYEKK